MKYGIVGFLSLVAVSVVGQGFAAKAGTMSVSVSFPDNPGASTTPCFAIGATPALIKDPTHLLSLNSSAQPAFKYVIPTSSNNVVVYASMQDPVYLTCGTTQDVDVTYEYVCSGVKDRDAIQVTVNPKNLTPIVTNTTTGTNCPDTNT
jgi:hypothetical protein